MASPKRTSEQRENDLVTISTLYLKGRSQSSIAQELGVSQPQISYDLKEIHRRWRESSLVNINEAKHKELARIDELERTYWAAWERSVGEVTKTTTSRSDKDGNRATITKETMVGNPSYLSGVQWCIEQRCKIFGIYEATKLTVDWRKAVQEQGHDAGEVFERLVNSWVGALNSDSGWRASR